MNYIVHLNKMLEQFGNDSRLSPRHVSLYMALFRQWNADRFPRWIKISRGKIMKDACIGSKTSYHRCIKNLHHWGYLKYKPSHAVSGSKVQIFLNPKSGVPLEGQPWKEGCLVLDHRCPNKGQLSLYNKHINFKKLRKEKKELIENFFSRKKLPYSPNEFLKWILQEYPERKRFEDINPLLKQWLKEKRKDESSKTGVAVEDFLKVKKCKRYDQPL